MSEPPAQVAFNIPPPRNPTPLPSTSQTEPAPKKKAAETSVDIDEHTLSIEAAADKYKTKVNTTTPGESFGLSDQEAATRLEANGPNCLTPPKKKSAILRYLEFLANLFNLLLIVAGVLNFILVAIDPVANKDSTIFGIVLIAVAFINATIEYYQEAKSAAILQSFLNMIPAQANVLRAGKLSSLPARELVTGDIVFIRLGDKVPADLLIVHASELKVDNSSLTGEAEPQERKNTNTTGAKNPLEAVNLVFNGTLAVAGEGYGIVIRTGDQTVLGQIAGMTDGEEKRPSPMSVEIDNLVKFTAFIAVVFAIVFFIVGFKVYPNIASNVNFAIGMLVAFVPQGLPATVSMLLTIAAKRLAKQNVLCKDLHGVETLGAITLLATDKTGTLTRNAMTVTNVWTGLNLYSATRSATDKGSPFVPDMPGAKEVLAGATLNTRARFDRTDVPLAERTVIGDATESGLMRWASSLLPDYDQYATTYPKVFEIPFNSDNKWAMTLHKKAHPTGDLTLFQKGAPERILRLCTTIYIDGQAVPLTDAHRQAYNDAYEFLAGTGQRVLAFAQALLPRSEYPLDYVFDKETANYPTDTLTFLGLVSLEDPPKHGVREAIGRCRSAGVQIIMVTGDHPLTAEAIGRKINLMLSETKSQIAKHRNVPIEQIDENEVDAIVIHGDHIDEMEDEDWDVAFSKSEIIFARTSPKHKLAIVKRAQGMGHIVGVTGDGVNDAPALKTADLGIAMNISGSDVSKEAATMILLDDNFASVVRGIEQGRLIFVNLKKSIQYTLTHITPEVVPSLLYILVPLPLAISPILILLIDLGFELIAALSFAWDRPESSGGLMKLPPRKPVTFASVDRFRNRAARQAAEREKLGYRTDHESGKEVQPSWPILALDKLKTPFKAQFWRDKFEDTEDEVLVDVNSMSYSYLEMGLIQTSGALMAYFAALWYYGISPSDAKTMQGDSAGTFGTSSASPLTVPSSGVSMDADTQATALGTAQATYYLSIMILQMWNMFIVKGRNRLPFGKFMVSNYMTFGAVIIGSGFGFFLVYTPDVNTGLKAHSVPVVILCISLGFGVVELLYATLRILFLRKFRPQKLNAEIDGLQMYPTVRSARSGRSNK